MSNPCPQTWYQVRLPRNTQAPGPQPQDEPGAPSPPPRTAPTTPAPSQTTLEARADDRGSIHHALHTLWKQGQYHLFLAAYRRLRPFLGLEEGVPHDQALEQAAARLDAETKPEVFKELALIRFHQGHPQARELVERVRHLLPRDPEINLAHLCLRLYADDPELNLETYAHCLPRHQREELAAALAGRPSPLLHHSLDILRCVACGATGLSETPSGSLRCPNCGRDYPVREGVPCLVEQPLESYRQVEPEYHQRFAQARVASVSGFPNFWRGANMLEPDTSPRGQRQRLKCLHGEAVHWDHLLAFFQKYAVGRGRLRILDVGSATGRDIFALARLFPHCDFFGVEVVLPGAQKAQRYRAHLRAQFIMADASQHLPFADHSLDIVISTNAIEHCRQRMMDEVFRVLKPGGLAHIAGPSQMSYLFTSPQAMQSYLEHLNAGRYWPTHGLSREEYLEMFQRFRILSHHSDRFFFRWLLESPAVDQLQPQAARQLFHQMCQVLGRALDADDQARWYNYIQMFVLQKPEAPAATTGRDTSPE